MIPRQVPSVELLRVAELQAAVVSPEQLRGHGFGRRPVERLVRDGHWQRLDSGLILTRPGPPDWESQAWSGVLLGGDAARLGGMSALHAAGAVAAAPDLIDVLVPHGRQLRDRDPWVFHRERPGVRDSRSRGGPPRIGIEDAVLDAIATLSEEDVVTLITTVVQSWQTTGPRLLRSLGTRDRVRHRQFLLALLSDIVEGAQSELERRFLVDVERPHGLPAGRRQVRAGTHVRDVWYELFRLIVELDGHLGHDGLGRFRDMARDNRSTVGGDRTLRYGWPDVTGRPCEVAFQIGYLLLQLGWEGPLTRCRRCRAVPDHEWVS